jgi:hypothetical protein
MQVMGRFRQIAIVLFSVFTFLAPEVYSEEVEYIEKPYTQLNDDSKTLIGTVFFSARSWKLNPEAHKEAMKIARALTLIEKYNSKDIIKLIGYANYDEMDTSLQLGLARAEELGRVLENYGVGLNDAIIASHGEFKSYEKSDTFRKVEVWVEDNRFSFLKSPLFIYIFLTVFFVIITILLSLLIIKRSSNVAIDSKK